MEGFDIKQYYQENKFRFKENHNNWIKNNRAKWNQYQAWYNRVRYWKNKLKLEPDNEELIQKLNTIYADRPTKDM